MPNLSQDVQTLAEFSRSPAESIARLRETRRPVVLTIQGRPAAVVQDAESYQRLLDIAALADAEEGIRLGLEDAANGRTRPAEEAFEQIRRKHAIPR